MNIKRRGRSLDSLEKVIAARARVFTALRTGKLKREEAVVQLKILDSQARDLTHKVRSELQKMNTLLESHRKGNQS